MPVHLRRSASDANTKNVLTASRFQQAGTDPAHQTGACHHNEVRLAEALHEVIDDGDSRVTLLMLLDVEHGIRQRISSPAHQHNLVLLGFPVLGEPSWGSLSEGSGADSKHRVVPS